MDDRHLRRAGLDYWQHLDWETVDDWSALLGRSARLPTLAIHQARRNELHGGGLRAGRRAWCSAASRRVCLESLVASYADRCLRIPMAAEARSLNLAVSVAVAAFEARRQLARPDHQSYG